MRGTFFPSNSFATSSKLPHTRTVLMPEDFFAERTFTTRAYFSSRGKTGSSLSLANFDRTGLLEAFEGDFLVDIPFLREITLMCHA